MSKSEYFCGVKKYKNMKFQSILFIAALAALFVSPACQSDSDASKNAATEGAGAMPDAAAPAATAPGQAEPPQNAAGVWHYTCPKGCEGGGAAATPCAKCGTALAHNQAYHGQAAATDGNPGISANPAAGAPGQAPVTLPNTAKPEPPQNAAGVWHYTCADGCAGGAGAATPCAKCGKALVHNTAYHK